MDTVVLKVPMPRQALLVSGLSKEQVAMSMLETFVLALYKQDRISAGKAAQLLGISKFDFIRILATHGIPYFNFTPEELGAEMQAVEEWIERHWTEKTL